MSSIDLEFFSLIQDLDFAPVSMEWVDSNSCNVIWALATSSARALLTLSRPIHVPEAALKEAEARAAKAAAATAEASSGNKEDEAMEEDDDMVRISKPKSRIYFYAFFPSKTANDTTFVVENEMPLVNFC